MEEEGQGPETLKTKPTCLITAWGWAWGEEQEEVEEGSPTQGEEEVAEGEEEEVQLSPQVCEI